MRSTLPFLIYNSSITTYLNSLGTNRYFMILNGGFAVLCLMGASCVKQSAQKYITGLLSVVFSVLITNMFLGYINVVLPQL